MRLRASVSSCIFILCLFLTGCGSLSTTDLGTDKIELAQNVGAEDLRQIVDNLAQPMVDTGHTPGVVVGVLLPDRSMQFFGYGVADQATGLKPDKDTLFAVGSLSKGFLGAVTANLVDQSILSWDETLETLLPSGTHLSPDAQKITLLQLATHTSGLPRQPVTPRTLEYFIEYLFDGENFYRHFDAPYVLDYLADFEADNPGYPRYSNVGYGLLGYILELRTGKTVDTLLDQIIVKPLNLTCTGYDPDKLPCHAFRAHGYAGDQPKFISRGNPVPDWQFTHFLRGSAALYSNAKDLLTFASAHIWDQQKRYNAVLASDMQARFPRAKEAAAVAWVVDDVMGEPITYQIGIVAGYTSYIGIDNAHKTAVVVLQNSFNWDNSIGHQVLLSLRYKKQE